MPRAAMLSGSCGLAGAWVVAILIRLSRTAGFWPVSWRRALSLSCTGTGVSIPPEEKAAEVFKQLFLQGTPAQIEKTVRKLDTGKSILDAVAGQAKDLQMNVGADDRDRLRSGSGFAACR